MSRRVQYVSQVAVKEFDVRGLTDREQDEFIKTVAEKMTAEMRARVKDAPAVSDVSFLITGPHNDPLQGLIHVHQIACWFDLDDMPRDAPFYLDATAQEASTGDRPVGS